jgi:hypothetical protein
MIAGSRCNVVLPYSAYGEKEGVRRIVTTGKLIVLIGITLGVLSVVVTFGHPEVLIGVSISLWVTALGGLVWAAGWIAEGFTRPDP